MGSQRGRSRGQMPRDVVDLIVSRKTHGAAFNPPPEGYKAMRYRIQAEVQQDHDTMTGEQFRAKYDIWMS